MKRIRTIFVSLVILLVSMTMALDAGAATSVVPDVGTDSVGSLPPTGDYLLGDTGGDDSDPQLPGGEGDPDGGFDAVGSKVLPGAGDAVIVGWTASSDVQYLYWYMDLMAILHMVMP